MREYTHIHNHAHTRDGGHAHECRAPADTWVHLETSDTCASMTSSYAYWSTPLVRALPLVRGPERARTRA